MSENKIGEMRANGRFRWLEVRVEVDGEAAEAVSELLGRIGTGGAVLEELAPPGGVDDTQRSYWVKAYMPVGSQGEELEYRHRVEVGLWHLSQIRPLPAAEFRLLEYQDWAEAWKANYRPLPIGEHFVIKPSWCEYQPAEGQVVIELDPGQAFGTGLHPSTQLSLVGLEKRLQPGQTVLDLGTGSGILAIAAMRLGAGSCLAIDIDPLAVDATRENARINGVADGIRVLQGSLPPRDGEDRHVVEAALEMAPGGFDLMLVNILAEIIGDMLTRGLADWLAPGGTMVMAGIIKERQEIVSLAAMAAGLRIVARREAGDWISLIARKITPE